MEENISSDRKIILPQMKMEVCSRCQNDCEMCAHGEMRRSNLQYELTLEQLENFLQVTEHSGYIIENIRIHGPGEPLLWKFINEGLQLLNQSPCIKTVFIATNGLVLDRLHKESWNYIDEMRISIYENTKNNKLISKYASSFPEIVNIDRKNCFRRLPDYNDVGIIPCKCICNGPMLYGDEIFLYCGPPIFGTSNYKKCSMDDKEIIKTPVAKGWYKNYQARKEGNLSFCIDCWANNTLKLDVVDHLVKNGKWFE